MNKFGEFIQFNSTGLPKTRCELIKRQILSAQKPLVLALNETFLIENGKRNLDDLLDLNKLGYKSKTKSRPQGSNPGGGVAIIYRDNLNYKSIKIPKKFQQLEAIVCEISGTYINKYTFCTYYNSPKKELNTEFLLHNFKTP